MSWVASGVTIAATLYSSYSQAQAIEEQSKNQAALAELNAKLAEVDAAEAERQGKYTENRFQSEADKAAASTTAFFAEAGIDTNDAGAAADIIAESKLNAALNKQDIQKQTFQQVSRFNREASDRRTQSQYDQENAGLQANATLISGYAGALGAGVKGYGNYAEGARAQKKAEELAAKKRGGY